MHIMVMVDGRKGCIHISKRGCNFIVLFDLKGWKDNIGFCFQVLNSFMDYIQCMYNILQYFTPKVFACLLI